MHTFEYFPGLVDGAMNGGSVAPSLSAKSPLQLRLLMIAFAVSKRIHVAVTSPWATAGVLVWMGTQEVEVLTACCQFPVHQPAFHIE